MRKKSLIFLLLAAPFLLFLCLIIEEVIRISSTSPKSPILEKNGFYAEIQMPCNRFHTLEIGFEIDPPIMLERVEYAQNAISGSVVLSIVKKNKIEKFSINLHETASSVSGKGLWVKVISRQPATWSLLCGKRKIIIEARDINFDLSAHGIFIYVSRDRRP